MALLITFEPGNWYFANGNAAIDPSTTGGVFIYSEELKPVSYVLSQLVSGGIARTGPSVEPTAGKITAQYVSIKPRLLIIK